MSIWNNESAGLCLKEMVERLCCQSVARGGSGVQEMTQVRLMMLPVSTNMSGPPRILTSGSEIVRVQRSNIPLHSNHFISLLYFINISFRKSIAGKIEDERE